MKIRPHHGLCIAHFKGLGYSQEFVENMQKVTAALRSEDNQVTLVCHTDDICCCCPHNSNGECESGQKVLSYDIACLEYCGLKDNQTIRWSEFSDKVMQNIILPGRLREVCRECQWLDICTNMKTVVK